MKKNYLNLDLRRFVPVGAFTKKVTFLLGTLLVLALSSVQVSAKDDKKNQSGSVKISVNLASGTLISALKQIESQSTFKFVYNPDQIRSFTIAKQGIEQQDIDTILKGLLAGTGLNYKIVGENVAVVPGKGAVKNEGIVIRGVVTDATNGEPLPGVNIVLKSTSVGTVTDVNGAYQLEVPNEEALLVFSFIGYERMEMAVGGRQQLSVAMQVAANGLDEVVVTAIGIEREAKALGYAVSNLKSEAINVGGNTDLATSLAGKVPGMQLTRSSGPLGSSRIVLRGEASLDMQKNRALLVVDGVPVTNDQNSDGQESYLGAAVDYGDGLSALNPKDIENITVLRGASAAALYGSQAVNGVLMITTKGGKFNQGLKVNVNQSSSIQQVNRWLPRQTEFGSGNRSENDYYAFKDSPDGAQNRNSHSWGPKFMGQKFYQYDSPHSAVYDPALRDEIWEFVPGGQTPWVGNEIEQNFYQTGYTHSTGVSVSAGNNMAFFRGSVNYLNNKYIMENTGYNRLNLSLSSGIKTGKTKFSTKINYARQSSANLPAEGYDRTNAHYQVFWLSANEQLPWYKNKLWLDGQQDVQQNTIGALSANPYWILHNSINTLDKDRVFGNIQLDHSFTDQLKLTARSGLDFYTELRTRERAWSEPRNSFGNYSETNLKTILLNTDVILTQNSKIGDFTIGATLGFNHRYTNGNGMYGEATSLKIPGAFNLQNSEELPRVSNSRRQKELVSAYGVANLSWKDIVFLDVTGRNDWTSTLSKNNNSYFYPSTALAVDLTELYGIDSPVLSYLKLRASYAQVGSDTDPYRLNRYYVSSTAISGGYSNPSTLPNPDLRPERTNSMEFGVNTHLFNHRFDLDLTFYRAVTKDQILSLPVDPASGYQSALMNAGSVSNQGVELQLNAKAVKSKSFNWDITANWATNKGRVEKLVPGVIDVYVIGSYVGSRVLVKAEPGEQLGRIYGKGYDRQNGQIVFKDGLAQRDNNEDFLGNVFPDWKAGLVNNLRYKNLNLSFQFDYTHGGNAYSITHFLMNYTGKSTKTVYGRESGAPYPSGAEYDMASGSWLQNQDGRFGVIGDGVMLDEESGQYVKNNVSAPAPYYYNAMYERDQIEGNVFKTTSLKLRNVRVSYNLPSIWGLKGAQIGVYGNELFLWTKFPSYDPELSVVNNGALTPGLEAVGSPSMRTIGIDLNINF
ncbi:TonB-linked SusC/RagA family outer membrane protein [Dyadobacter jejuensis]|uniref:TonB-linked SusC/RagA family outer membrane protein n=1 Tax=Dyadobacter jejuensis TaxID=1082580 RepID=A0A316ASQ8_9BACT|nr:SusC/RagA family TonB-linked outer membrane protein [Dyadobacter jejuensis]PWJ60602.1 TonB-linked SusC/RagA family outer membrane protein [Dyadobacter jejuensis]